MSGTKRTSHHSLGQLLCAILLAQQAASICHDINTVELQVMLCSTTNGTQFCRRNQKQELRLNSVQKKVCLRLLYMNETIGELHVELLRIEQVGMKISQSFTRDVTRNVEYIMRCPTSGSCRGEKCASINETTLLPELDVANRHRGFTYCHEGSPGWSNGCALPTTACLFYRTYVEQRDTTLYEVARFTTWRTQAALRIFSRLNDRGEQTYEMNIRVGETWTPNGELRIQANDVHATPHSFLYNNFLINKDQATPLEFGFQTEIRCDRKSKSIDDCYGLRDTCVCSPKANRVSCACIETNLSEIMKINPLPIRSPEFQLRLNNGSLVSESHSGSVAITIGVSEKVLDFLRQGQEGEATPATEDLSITTQSDINGAWYMFQEHWHLILLGVICVGVSVLLVFSGLYLTMAQLMHGLLRWILQRFDNTLRSEIESTKSSTTQTANAREKGELLKKSSMI